MGRVETPKPFERPETWVTDRSGHMGYTFSPKGFSSGSSVFSSTGSGDRVRGRTLLSALRRAAAAALLPAQPIRLVPFGGGQLALLRSCRRCSLPDSHRPEPARASKQL